MFYILFENQKLLQLNIFWSDLFWSLNRLFIQTTHISHFATISFTVFPNGHFEVYILSVRNKTPL